VKQCTQDPLTANSGEDFQGCPVLIFSNDRGVLDYYRRMFANLGFAPVTATTAEAAVALLRLMIVAFVIVDQGDEFYESRRVVERARQTQVNAPVLLISQNADPDFRHQALAIGATACLNHPVLPDDIVHALIASETQTP
jgi:DNA-binding response OmpR family regulator